MLIFDPAAAALAQAAAYVNFTNKADGAPPSYLDTGQAVDFHFNATNREPIISAGRLVVSSVPGSGALADYYQSDLGSPVTRVGAQWTQPAGADNGQGIITYAAWGSVYEGGGTTVPKAWIHMSIITGTGTALWYIVRGVAGPSNENLIVAKQQTFTPPVADGVTRWSSEALLDVAGGIAYAWLPDGALMTLTNAEIATACTALGVALGVSIPAPTLASLSTATVIMCEHFAVTAPGATFGGFTSFYGDITSSDDLLKNKALSPLLSAKRAKLAADKVPPPIVPVSYDANPVVTVASTTGAANVDGTNGKVTAVAGPTGKITVLASVYYEWTATDTVFWRLAGTVSTTARAVDVGVAGTKKTITQAIVMTGLTPGNTYTETLQHFTTVAGTATAKIGGSGGGLLPPMTLVAIPS